LPVSLGGVTVNAGDVVAGDHDGVVVIAREALSAVVAALDDVAVKERNMDALVAGGATLPPGLEEIIAAKGVRYVDA
jgi:regulator of RNase E activity RraA